MTTPYHAPSTNSTRMAYLKVSTSSWRGHPSVCTRSLALQLAFPPTGLLPMGPWRIGWRVVGPGA